MGLPSDHHIGNEDEMAAAFKYALRAAAESYLVTFGIRPTRPETGYGYIRLSDPFMNGVVYHADAFVEKPDVETAVNYIEAGNYLWNSGMFLFSTKTLLAEYKNHAVDILEKVCLAIDHSAQLLEASEEHYAVIPKAPFDKAIMEKSSCVAIVPCDPAWSDIGSWESLWEISEKDSNGNVIEGNVACQSTRNCLIYAKKRLVACAGVENLVIIDTGDALLIADRSDGDSMRSLVQELKEKGHVETVHPAPD